MCTDLDSGVKWRSSSSRSAMSMAGLETLSLSLVMMVLPLLSTWEVGLSPGGEHGNAFTEVLKGKVLTYTALCKDTRKERRI